MASDRAEIRADFMKRLFAVAISVGAANTLSNMGWVQSGGLPSLAEWQQLSILTAAITATVLSWDGYLLAIKDRPLEKFGRFVIDIILVFVYMILLMTSRHPTWWLIIHVIIFVLYIIWDFFTISEYKEKYITDDFKNKLDELPADKKVDINSVCVMKFYSGGLTGSNDYKPGPAITFLWGLYFLGLNIINFNTLETHVFGTTAFVLIGLYIYRKDKISKENNLTMQYIVIIMLLVSNYLFKACGPRDSTIANWIGIIANWIGIIANWIGIT